MMAVLVVLCTVDWPAHGPVEMVISGFKKWFSVRLFEAGVHMCFNIYHDYSTNGYTTPARATANLIHQLNLNTSLPAPDAELKKCANNEQLNTLIWCLTKIV